MERENELLQELRTWKGESLRALYASPHAVQGVLRILPPLVRVLVMKLFVCTAWGQDDSSEVLATTTRSWFRRLGDHERALEILCYLHIVERKHGTEAARIALTQPFGRRLMELVQAVVENPFCSSGESTAVDIIDEDELDRYSRQRWERVLHFLVGTIEDVSPKSRPSVEVIQCMLRTNLLQDLPSGLQITKLGFQFLLAPRYVQVWRILIDIMKNKFQGPDLGTAMNILFQLGSSARGVGYSLKTLSPVEFEMINVVHELGGVYLSKTHFVPSVTGVNLIFQGEAKKNDTDPEVVMELGSLKVIVETNFRLYAYTSSSFQVGLLQLFTTLKYRLPNLAVGQLTRESVRNALMNGISSGQIIKFLNSHRHPRMLSGGIPPNVSDELRLWEAERDRVSFVAAVLFDNFRDETAFSRARSHAEDYSSLLWCDVGRRTIVIRKDFSEKFKEFLRR